MDTSQITCTCRTLLETAFSALNNLCSDKVSCNIEKVKRYFISDNEYLLLYYRTEKNCFLSGKTKIIEVRFIFIPK